MARNKQLFFGLNRGETSGLALGRVDIEHLRMAATSQINWLPRVVGPMMFRPGTDYIGQVLGNQAAEIIPYVAAFDDTALLELTPDAAAEEIADESKRIERAAAGLELQAEGMRP